MRKIWMFVVLLSFAIGVKANHYESAIVIKSQGDAGILVQIDRHRSPQMKSVHKFNHIRPGRHYVEIYRQPRQHPHAGHQPPRLVYRGHVNAQQGFKTVYVLSHGNLRVVSRKRLSHGNSGCSIHGSQNCNCNSGLSNWNHGTQGGCGSGHGGHSNYGHGNGHGYGHGNQGHGQQHGCNGSCGQQHYGSQWQSWNNWNNGSGYGGHHWGNDHGYYNGHQPMPYNDFWSFMNRMKRNVTDVQKVDMAKRELDNKWLTTEQVNVLMDDLFFEQQKLELAQNLYHRTVDPEKYNSLESQFDFSSNKRKLSEYVERNASK
ncbi:MAG: DUF4476 domain-containing protein [Bacteroidetes bacterium]|nr:DUF4476 domain-containing protein [Bacteroidota bacterium]